MPGATEEPERKRKTPWQDLQTERWSVVHCLLLSSASHPQTSLSLGGKKPILVEALVYAAPPQVISLLMGASTVLMSFANKATAFAGSALYSCITRHYPLHILVNLAEHCPNDVRTVRDETGMGLISAQFLSGLFDQVRYAEEWTVNDGFHSELQKAIHEGVLDTTNEPFVDWWRKVEYLIAFCSGHEKPMESFKEHLLHAALRNNDTPPSVIRLLLSLYPESVVLPDPLTGALPLHIACKSAEYTPRNYELQIMEESVAGVILAADSSASRKTHNGRLPLHYAAASGKSFAVISALIENNPMHLRIVDPHSGFYPFQQLAAYSMKNDQDSFRQTCVARNKYSHHVWQGLSHRQRAAAIMRVAEVEEVSRVWTIFECMRREPSTLESARFKDYGDNGREDDGMGPVSSHFLSWCYSQEARGKWTPKVKNIDELRNMTFNNINTASEDFKQWWLKLKELIEGVQCDGCLSRVGTIPKDDNFLLHAALQNSDTPPPVVQLLMNMFPISVKLPLPSGYLPLHIAATTLSYSPRPFESTSVASLLSVLAAMPDAAAVTVRSQLPLHLAILCGKAWNELMPLIEAYPESLKVPDPGFHLCPFQLMAARRDLSREERRQVQTFARHRFRLVHWKRMIPKAKVIEIQRVRRERDQAKLNAVFNLLRSDPRALVRPLESSVTGQSIIEESYCDEDESISILPPGLEMLDTDVSSYCVTNEMTENSSLDRSIEIVEPSTPCSDQRSATIRSVISEASRIDHSENYSGRASSLRSGSGGESIRSQESSGQESALERLLSQHSRKRESAEERSKDATGLFECDASVFSGVDVMLMLSSHHPRGSRRDMRSVSNRGSAWKGSVSGRRWPISVSDEEGDAESYSSFAIDEESMTPSRSSNPTGSSTSSDDHILSANPSFEDESESQTSENSTAVVFFKLRRKPRAQRRMPDADISMRSSRRARHRLSMGSTCSTTIHSLSASAKKQTNVDMSTSHDSFGSLNPGDLYVKKESNGPAWIGSTSYDKKLLGSMGSSSMEEDLLSSQDSFGSPSQRQASKQASASLLDSGNLPMAPSDETSTSDMGLSSTGVSSVPDSFANDSASAIPNVKKAVDMMWLCEVKSVIGTPKQSDKYVEVPSSSPQDKSTSSRSVGGISVLSSPSAHKHTTAEVEIRFDKAAMRWIKIPKVPASSESHHESTSTPKKEVYFDKKSMRWKTKETSVSLSSPSTMLPTLDEDSKLDVKPYPLKPSTTFLVEKPTSREDTLKRNRSFSTNAKHAMGLGRYSISGTTRGGRSSSRRPSKNLACMLCRRHPREVLLLPCHHMSTCRYCSSRDGQNLEQCPLCSAEVTKCLPIF